MDPQSDQPGMTKAPSPLFVGEKYVGNITRNGTAVIERTPSPLFFDDTDVGDAGSRYVPASSNAATPERLILKLGLLLINQITRQLMVLAQPLSMACLHRQRVFGHLSAQH